MQTYTLRDLRSMLGISKAVVHGLIASGFVAPGRGQRNEYRFTFQDVVVLRTAYGLRQANISPRKIVRSLQRLREMLPAEMPLSGLRISAVGSEIAVQEGASRRQVESGQLLFDFDVRPVGGTIDFLLHGDRARARSERGTGPELGARDLAAPQRNAEAEARAAPSDAEIPEDWFERGSALESESRSQAEAAYRRAIELAPDYVDPYLNLGVMMCDAGRCAEAVQLYHDALRQCPGEALLHFNLAVALEDLERNDEALESYESCLRLAPKLADAHYNAARLHELSGHRSQAIRHYSEYRRLQR